ncbi:MAG TPA: ABC transporter ATP-binding protein [Mycobacteriales bacterium]|jgi:branched-chain amino acid transport system ATP-binding protein|nr:ABC transporter ATP-binding protein [Mycobacteriales bacterium]
MSTPLLELDGLSVSYGGMRALSDVSLLIPEGGVVALLGANGAGKTTTLRTISGLVRAEAGKIRFRGRSVERTAPHRISAMGIMHVPEGRGIFRSLTVAENLEMAEYGRGRAAKGTSGDVIEQAVEQFPALGDRLKQTAGTLSGGEQQMLALARAFVAQPKLLMLDEISMGLAPKITEQLFEAIRAVAASGVGMLLIEQYVDAALSIADFGYVLEKGRIVDLGDPGDLRSGDALATAYLGAKL